MPHIPDFPSDESGDDDREFPTPGGIIDRIIPGKDDPTSTGG